MGASVPTSGGGVKKNRVPFSWAAKQRIDIFWQRRVRQGDETTPYWFPAQTNSGALREERIVLPIPPGTHWRDAKPIVLPGMQQTVAAQPSLPTRTRPPAAQKPFVQKVAVVAPSRHLGQVPPGKAAVVTASGIRYLDRADHVPHPSPGPRTIPSSSTPPGSCATGISSK